MKLLKKILFVLIAIVALALIIALFVNDEYAVTKTVVVEEPKEEVFEYIRHLKNQDDYGIWLKKDPDAKKTYKGEDGTVGFISKWNSKHDEVGIGEQEITNIKDGERIDFLMRFKKPQAIESDAFMTTESLGENKTKVSWGFKGKIGYPMNLMLLFMDMEEMAGPDLQKGLDNLKVILESGDSE